MPNIKESIKHAYDSLDDVGYRAYLEHFKAIQPRTGEEVFRRFLFSFLSVQINWQKNVTLYRALEDYDWSLGVKPIQALFKQEGVGFQNTRPRFIMDFADRYHDNTDSLHKQESENWIAYRARLDHNICGLAKAKLSFTAEMCYSETSELICFDRHMLREVFFTKRSKHGYNCNYTNYKKYEKLWVKEGHARGMAPAVARLLYWDRYQGYEDSLFWTEVFA